MIRIRPYYLYSVFRQLAAMDAAIEENSLFRITERLAGCAFREDIQLVHGFCDCCQGCPKMVPDPAGCLWGPHHRCTSAETAGRLNQVEDQMRSILYDLEMRFGDTMSAGPLLKRAAERRPFHYFHIPEWQAAYEAGVKVFSGLSGLAPVIPPETRSLKPFYYRFI
ncbi:MAG: hypothetical protein JW909_14060 [Planctomycetes bacterium]|nr:hypothetical protein [Planctomycetota bacterium]